MADSSHLELYVQDIIGDPLEKLSVRYGVEESPLLLCLCSLTIDVLQRCATAHRCEKNSAAYKPHHTPTSSVPLISIGYRSSTCVLHASPLSCDESRTKKSQSRDLGRHCHNLLALCPNAPACKFRPRCAGPCDFRIQLSTASFHPT